MLGSIDIAQKRLSFTINKNILYICKVKSQHHYREMYNDYIIADSLLRISGPISDLATLGLHSFSPFKADTAFVQDAMLEITTGCDIELDGVEAEILTEFDFAEGEAVCRFMRNDEEYIFTLSNDKTPAHIFRCRRDDCSRVQTNVGVVEADSSFMRFGIWFMFNLWSVQRGAVAVHSSVIVYNGEAVMFLGESGTGKSTHTRLWRETILGAELLNDDSPYVRVHDGRLYAYGSPWSGKTACYRNESYPVRGVVRLSQAPYNAIHRLPGVRAIGALLPSLPPAFAFDAQAEDAIMATLSEIITHTKVYHLECLPDAAAARLSYETIYEAGESVK